MGLYPKGVDELASDVSAALKKVGFAGDVNEWVMTAKGAKCLSNLRNAMGAITNGRGNSEAFMAEVRREAKTVWSAAEKEWEDWTGFNKRIKMSRGTTRMPKGYEKQRNLGSSWQSLIRGTGNIEAEELNSDVIKLGRLLGITTPHNELLWHLADEITEKY
ncbi:MAG: 2-dehydropantoate 2-reductase [Thermoproteota archaeon]|nr:2-dehydropantoate 2-reductase [Thermoproteota archaeon]